MKNYVIMSLLTGFIIAQSTNIDQGKDSTFIVLKSGDSIRVNKLDASFTLQPMIKFDLGFFDFDSTQYEISDINKIVNSKGKTSVRRNSLFMINFFHNCLNISINLILFYLIIV